MAQPISETEIPQKPPAPPVPPSARTPAGAPGTVSDRIAAWLQHPSLPHMQTIVGLLAGLLSIGGFAYSYFWVTAPVVPTRGDVIAAAVDARTEKTIADATLEVFTLKDARSRRTPAAARGTPSRKVPTGCGSAIRASTPRRAPFT